MLTKSEPTRTSRAWGPNPWVQGTFISTTSFSVPGNADLANGTSVQILNNGVMRSGYVASSNFASNVTTIVVEGATALTNANLLVRFGGETGNPHLSRQYGYVDVQGSFVSRGVGDFVSGSTTTVNGSWQFNSVPTFAGGASGAKGGELRLQDGVGNSLSGTHVVVDTSGNYIRFYESGPPNKGVRIDLTTGSTNAASDIWHSGNFDPASKLNVTGGTLTGLISHYYGSVSSNTIMQRYGWVNAVQRWAWGIESDAGFALYAYDTLGGSTVTALSIKTTVAGGSDQLQFRGNNVWHGGNFDPASKLTRSGDTATGQIIFEGQPLTSIALSTANLGALLVRSTGGTNFPAIAFQRVGTHGVYLGLGSDNNLQIGGWSHGNNAWKIWHGGAGDLSTTSSVTAASIVSSGAITAGTTLSVTGAATFASTVTVSGNLSAANLTATNVVTAVSGSFTGALSVGSLGSNASITATTHIIASTYMQAARWLYVGGATGFGGQTTQGTYITWNHNAGLGESGFYNNRGAGAGGFDFYCGTGGTYTRIARILANGDFASLSDASQKKDFTPMDAKEALNFIANVNSGFFEWIRDGRLDVGYLANDVEKWAKRLVNKDSVGMRTLAYQKVSAYHHTALKYVLSETEQLRSRVTALEAELENLRGG